MLEFLVERRRLGDLVELAVDLHPLEAALEKVRELLAILSLAPAHDGRHQVEAGALRQPQDTVDHLRHGLALDGQPGRRRIRHADARPQQPHVVVDLRDGPDRRARILRGRLLLDRDRRGEAVDLVDVRLLHHLQELPRIGRKAFDIAPLPLGIDRVERQRGFAGAGQAREHDQAVARNLEVDILEVVLARTPDGEDPRLGTAAVLFETIVHACWSAASNRPARRLNAQTLANIGRTARPRQPEPGGSANPSCG